MNGLGWKRWRKRLGFLFCSSTSKLDWAISEVTLEYCIQSIHQTQLVRSTQHLQIRRDVLNIADQCFRKCDLALIFNSHGQFVSITHRNASFHNTGPVIMWSQGTVYNVTLEHVSDVLTISWHSRDTGQNHQQRVSRRNDRTYSTTYEFKKKKTGFHEIMDRWLQQKQRKRTCTSASQYDI
jgi:hypothetical protein